MNYIENKLIELLSDLKDNHGALGVKAEFEDEGATVEEILLLKKIATCTGVELTIKIGGCGALNDINQSKNIKTNSIVAPMIESAYGLKKFINTVNLAYYNQEEKPKLFINIETINGYKNFDEILKTEEFKDLTGVIVGRFDLAKSLDLECKDCNSEKVFNIVQEISEKISSSGKIFTVGGGVDQNSLESFKKLFKINMFETRKIIFDAEQSINNNDNAGILKAINFEVLWINLKQNTFGYSTYKDIKRLNMLKTRLLQNDLILTK